MQGLVRKPELMQWFGTRIYHRDAVPEVLEELKRSVRDGKTNQK